MYEIYNEMSLEEQIRCMEDMRNDLENYCIMMDKAMETLQSYIKFLRSQGFSTETEETYQKGYYIPAKVQVDQVIDDIHKYHFDYIDRVIDRLERAKNER